MYLTARQALRSAAQMNVIELHTWNALLARIGEPDRMCFNLAGLGISVPLAWDELPAVGAGDHWTLRNVALRLALGNGPWAPMARRRTGLAAAMKKLRYAP